MFWEEKIDLVKKQFSQPEFDDPFRSGRQIIEKIIRHFHNSTPLKFSQTTDRKSLIKNCSLIKQCCIDKFYKEELEKLENSTNYWLFLNPDNINRVYDCQKAPLRYLLYLSSGQKKQEFYIVHKKYLWAVYFESDKERNVVEIYKCGNGRTIFE